MAGPKYNHMPRRLAFANDNTGGAATEVLFAPKSFFTTIKGTKTTLVAPGDSVTIDGNHVFAPNLDNPPDDYGFIKLETEQDVTELMAEAQGENGGKSFKLSLKAYLVGQDKITAEQARLMKNELGIAMVRSIDKDPNTGLPVYWQLGNEDLLCYVVPGWGTGAGPAGKKGFPVTIEVSSNCPIQFYEGTITYLTVAP
jgi:hypothetical protein